jgi:hypothetical protein
VVQGRVQMQEREHRLPARREQGHLCQAEIFQNPPHTTTPRATQISTIISSGKQQSQVTCASTRHHDLAARQVRRKASFLAYTCLPLGATIWAYTTSTWMRDPAPWLAVIDSCPDADVLGKGSPSDTWSWHGNKPMNDLHVGVSPS